MGAPPSFDPMENKLMGLGPGQQLFFCAVLLSVISQHISPPSTGCWFEHCHTRGCPLAKSFPPVPVNSSVLDKNHQQFMLSQNPPKISLRTFQAILRAIRRFPSRIRTTCPNCGIGNGRDIFYGFHTQSVCQTYQAPCTTWRIFKFWKARNIIRLREITSS